MQTIRMRKNIFGLHVCSADIPNEAAAASKKNRCIHKDTCYLDDLSKVGTPDFRYNRTVSIKWFCEWILPVAIGFPQ